MKTFSSLMAAMTYAAKEHTRGHRAVVTRTAHGYQVLQ
jgi:hypothetical protein